MTHPGYAAEERWRRLTWLDLRLVPVAAAVWAGTLAAPWAPPSALAVTCLTAVAVAVVPRWGRRANGTVVLVVLAGTAVATGAGAVHGWQRVASPLRAPDVMGGSVEAVLHLDGDLRVLGGGAAPRGLADATVTGLVEVRGVREVRAAVLLFAPLEGWRELLPGQRARARIGVAPARPGDTVVAVVSARGPPTAVESPAWWQAAAGAVRAGLAGSAARVLAPRPAGLLPGLVVGDTSRADPVLEEDFRSAGLAHLTAVSGDTVS